MCNTIFNKGSIIENFYEKSGWKIDKEKCLREASINDFFSVTKKNAVTMFRPEFSKTETNEYYFKTYENPVKFTKNNYFTTRSVFAMDKNSIFFVQFRSILLRLFETGLIDQFSYSLDYYFKINFKEYERKKDEIILSWNYLYAGFYVWFGALLISFVVFVCELLYSKFMKKKHI